MELTNKLIEKIKDGENIFVKSEEDDTVYRGRLRGIDVYNDIEQVHGIDGRSHTFNEGQHAVVTIETIEGTKEFDMENIKEISQLEYYVEKMLHEL